MTADDMQTDAVLSDALSGRDRGGDNAPPAPQTPPAEQTPRSDAPPTADATSPNSDKPRDPQTGRYVPLAELQEERRKRQEKDRELEQMRGELRAYQQRLLPAEQQRQPQPPPDPWTDPGAAIQHAVQGVESKLQQLERLRVNDRLNFSETVARRTHGDELVTKARDAALSRGLSEHFVGLPDPYGELVSWFQRAQVLETVGPDVSSFEKKVREDERKRLLAELNKGGTQPQTRYPGTLADATAAGPQGSAPISDEQMLSRIYASGRQRR